MASKFRIKFQTKANRYLHMFDAPQREALIDEYISSVGFGKNANFGGNAFDSFLQSKVKGLDGFKDTKNDKDKAAFRPKVLEDATTQTTVDLKQSLATAFDPAGYDAAKRNYNNSMRDFKTLTDGRPPKYAPQVLVDHVKGIQQQAMNEIEAQQAIEKSNLEGLFNNSSFLSNLAATTPGVDQAILKENMIDDLKEAHKKQKDNLQKEFDTVITNLHNSNKVEREKWLFVAMLYDNNMMRKEILALAEQNAPADTAISVGVNKTQISFANINPQDLGIIKTVTGKKLIPSEDGKGYYMNFGFTSLFTDQRAELKLLAFAMKASGHDSVTYDVEINPNQNPPKIALACARELYAASIEAGFEKQKVPKDANDKSADKITFRVNGKLMRVDEIFKGHEAELNEIQARADTVKQQANAFDAKQGDGSTSAAELKNELTTLRANANAAAAAPPPPPPPSLGEAADPVVANAAAVNPEAKPAVAAADVNLEVNPAVADAADVNLEVNPEVADAADANLEVNPEVADAAADVNLEVNPEVADVNQELAPELPQVLPEIADEPPLPNSEPPVIEGKPEEVPQLENGEEEAPSYPEDREPAAVPMSEVEEQEQEQEHKHEDNDDNDEHRPAMN